MLCCSPAWLVLAPAATASSYPRKNACHRSDVCLETLPKAGEGTGFSAGGGSGHVITARLTASGGAWVKHRALGRGLSLCLLSQQGSCWKSLLLISLDMLQQPGAGAASHRVRTKRTPRHREEFRFPTQDRNLLQSRPQPRV